MHRFSLECLFASISLAINKTTAATADAPAKTEKVRLNPLTNGDFIPECLAGGALQLCERVDVLMWNQVTRTLEKSCASIARYIGLTHRTAKREPGSEFGPDFNVMTNNYFMPTKSADLAKTAEDRSDKLKNFAATWCVAGNSTMTVCSPLYAFPFAYDPVLAQSYGRKDILQKSKWFPPGTNIEVMVTLKKNIALRALGAEELNTAAGRTALRVNKPTVNIEKMWLSVEKIRFPEKSEFVETMEKERKREAAIEYPFTSFSEIRENIISNQTEQRIVFNLHQMQYPKLVYFLWMLAAEIDGTNGSNQNHSVFKFLENLDKLDITYAGVSILPTGGPVKNISSPNTETPEKFILYKDQMRHRREPDTYDAFYSKTECLQQYILVELDPIYAGKSPKEWTALDNIEVDMGFTTDLSPKGWQMIAIGVHEGRLGIRPDNTHYIVNSSGAVVEGG